MVALRPDPAVLYRGAQRVYRRAKLWIDRASGGVMALLGRV